MSSEQLERVAIIGLGLIGGSLALALKKTLQQLEVWGYDRDAATLEQANASGLMAYPLEQLGERIADAQVVVIATPGMQVESVARQLRDLPEAICITDTGSTKDSVLAAANQTWPQGHPNLVLSHPLAGQENSGFSSARADLFTNQIVLISALASSRDAAVQGVSQLWRLVGAVPTPIAVEGHDALMAITSHLPHMLAFSLVRLLVEQVGETGFDYTAGGFRDFSRIASSNPEMWADIAMNNAEHVRTAMEQYGNLLHQLAERIGAGDRDWVHDFFTGAAEARSKYYGEKSP